MRLVPNYSSSKKESTFFQQQNYDREKNWIYESWGLPKIAFFHILGAPSIVSQKLHGTLLLLRMYVYNRQNFIDEQTKVARCRWEIMQPNGNNSHSSKCRKEQKKKDNFSRPQSPFERPLVSEKRCDFSLDLNEVKLFFFLLENGKIIIFQI